jgi:hypothetical protein
MDSAGQAAILTKLGDMPAYLNSQFGHLTREDATRPGPDNGFSPAEQCWHLVDLEREGFARRIERIRQEDIPALPDFDGSAIARDRNYRSKSLSEALAEFRNARAESIALIQAIRAEEWTRNGVQDGVGPVNLCDIPVMMLEHDTAHRAEIEAWLKQ